MLCLNSEIKWNVRSIAVGFYAYILHTRIDYEPGDIVFAFYDENRLKRIIIETTENSTFFDMLATSKVVDYLVDDLDERSISAVFTKDSFETMDYLKFNISIIRRSHELTIDFNRDFNYYQQQNFSRYFLRVVKYSLSHGDCKLADYSILRENEIYPIKHAFDATAAKYDENRLIIKDFYDSFIKNSSRTCIVFQDCEYSYSYIDEQSNRIANMLHRNGVSHRDGVIIFMNRSERLLSSILGVMKCAAFYLPVDISTPIERVCDIISDSKAKAVLVDSTSFPTSVENSINTTLLNVISADVENSHLDFDRIIPSPSDPCYMIYTSGTTGKPKGVMVYNKNIANFVSNNILNNCVLKANIETPCIIAPNKVGFDAFVGDTLLSIACGFKIVMASDEELDNPRLFVKAIKKNRVNIIQTTPTRLNISLLSYLPDALKRLKVIACGGEPLVAEVINKIKFFAPNSTLINVYGPTETTVWSAAANITEGDRGIGLPAQNTRCYILNRFQKFLPNYETGILYIGGDGLGRYCFDDKNQKAKFVTLVNVGEKVYNSGDTAYLDEKNYIIYGARADSQVKINGVRIELGDIESVAKKSPLIMDCAAAVKEIPQIGRRLVLYYTSDVSIASGEFRGILSQLPDAYIPNYYVHLKHLPLTSSSKVDRKSLPLPEINNDEEIVLPKTEIERILYSAVSQILEKEHQQYVISINKPIADYGITSRQISSIISFLESRGFSGESYRKKINVHKSIFDISKSFEDSDGTTLQFRDFPRYSFEHLTDKSHYSCVFLTGASGFLGSHVLASLLKNTKARIICLCHNTDISKTFKAYQMNVSLDTDRVVCVYGSLSEENFGLLDEDLELVESADEIINCAAYVKYYGDADLFYKTNVLSVKKLIDFAIKNKMILNHISTLSVLGTKPRGEITEQDFWIGQSEIFDNQYVESKLTAENEILRMRENGLKYRIIRVGRLAWREDGIFQRNCDDNEFFATLKLFETMKKVPKELLQTKLEVSPVDTCANAIVVLSNCNNINGTFHVMNPETVSLANIIDGMNQAGCNIEPVDMNVFMAAYKALPAENIYKAVTSICCVSKNSFLIEHNDAVANDLTKKTLSKKFIWPKLDARYFGVLFKRDK